MSEHETNLKETPAVVPVVVPPLRRWHWSTYLLGTFVLLVCVLLNWGGDWNPRTKYIDHGWPWVYEVRNRPIFGGNPLYIYDKHFHWTYWFDLQNNLRSFRAMILWANLGVAILVVITVCFFWEVRLRRLKHWLQFTLLDWLLFCVFFAGGYAWLVSLYRDNKTEQGLLALLNRHNIQVSDFFTKQGAVISETIMHKDGADVPCDWFWDVLSVPISSRPYRRIYLHCPLQANDVKGEEPQRDNSTIPQEYFFGLTKLRSLEGLLLQIDNSKARKLSCASDSFLELQKCPNLNQFCIMPSGDFLTEEHLDSIAKIPSLIDVYIYRAPSFRGHNLAKLSQLKNLTIQETAIDDQSIEQIGKLKNLEHLMLVKNPHVTTNAWRALKLSANLSRLCLFDEDAKLDLIFLKSCSQLKHLSISSKEILPASWKHLAASQALQSVTISCSDFDDEALTYLENAPKLKYLTVLRHSLTRNSLSSLKKMPALEDFSLASPKAQQQAVGKKSFSTRSINIQTKIGFTAENEQQFLKIIEDVENTAVKESDE